MRSLTVCFFFASFVAVLGLANLAGAQGSAQEQKGANRQHNPPRVEPTSKDPVLLSNGDFDLEATDMRVKGRGMDFTFTRRYRSGSAVSSALGSRWTFNWDQRIVLEYEGGYIPPYIGPGGGGGPRPDPIDKSEGPYDDLLRGGNQAQSQSPGGGGSPGGPGAPTPDLLRAHYYNGELRIDTFEFNSLTGEWTTPDGYFAKLRVSVGSGNPNKPPKALEMRTRDGMVYTFYPGGVGNPYVKGYTYLLTSVQDRKGNEITLHYDWISGALNPNGGYWRLRRINDTLGRDYILGYQPISPFRLDSLNGPTGRIVEYLYESGQLAEVRSPAVTTAWNPLPARGVRYEYGTEHRLEKIIDADEWRNGTNGSPEAHVVNTYENGHVVKQQLGGVNSSNVAAGGTTVFIYEDSTTAWSDFTESKRLLQVEPNGGG